MWKAFDTPAVKGCEMKSLTTSTRAFHLSLRMISPCGCLTLLQMSLVISFIRVTQENLLFNVMLALKLRLSPNNQAVQSGCLTLSRKYYDVGLVAKFRIIKFLEIQRELAALAMQPSHKFDKEGVLLMNEKVDHGLFRRSEVSCERWCRLRGNLLFYFKNKDQYSEPAGLVVLEQCEVQSGCVSGVDDPLAFTIYFSGEGGGTVQFASTSESERDSWIQAVHMASYDYIRSQLKTLQDKLTEKIEPEDREIYESKADQPCLELSLSCDNLVCDGDGLPPNPMIVARILKSDGLWSIFGKTEVIQRSSNPCFLTTVTIPLTDVDSVISKTKLTVYDVRERLTATMSVIGATSLPSEKQELNDLRLKLNCDKQDDGPCVGFISIVARPLLRNIGPLSIPESESPSMTPSPQHLPRLYCNTLTRTYRFHAGLGSDLSLQEIMGESRWCFLIPQKIVQLFIAEEKDFLAALASLENLKEEWKMRQKELLEQHLHLINMYTMSLHEMDSNSGSVYFKPSSAKCCRNLEFVPVNLHLQRIVVYNESLRKNGIYDVQTVGCFAAHTLKFRHGGLSRLLTHGTIKDKLSRSADAVSVIEELKNEVSFACEELIGRLVEGDSQGAMNIMNHISSETKRLKGLLETELVEDACRSLEDLYVGVSDENSTNRIIHARSRSLSLGTQNANGLVEDLQNVDAAKKKFIETRHLSLKEKLNNVRNEDRNCNAISQEPEPWDLTQLNIEASVMCMEAKIKSLLKTSVKCATNETETDVIKSHLMPCINKLQQAVECLRGTAVLTHLVQLFLEPSQNSTKILNIRHRRDVVFTQIVTSVIIALGTRLFTQTQESLDQYLSIITSTGLLVQFEGLLSCQGEEMGMLEDMKVAVNDLMSNVEIYLSPWSSEQDPLPSITGNRRLLKVTVPVPKSSYDKLLASNYKGKAIQITAPFVNVGINEQASFAERESCAPSCMQVSRRSPACMSGPKLPTYRFGDVSVQDQINNEGVEKMRHYFKMVCPILSQEKSTIISQSLDRLSGHVQLRKPKNVEILHIAARITRQLGGLRFTSCKSAKDRSSMSVTLEQLMILKEDFNLADHEVHRALDCMRCEGTRRENTLKNAGVRKYAFNSLQLLALHRLYRPPAGTYGNVQT
ncbi:hypothetical protein CHUAL_003960 [Chamberlinius hualienensis]